MIESIKKNIKSYGHAFRGVLYVIKHENNIKYQLFAGLVAVILGYYLKLSQPEWYIIIMLIGLVLSAEVMNTAIEKLVDMVSPDHNEAAGLIKDIAAGAVLIISLAAAIIGFIIFLG